MGASVMTFTVLVENGTDGGFMIVWFTSSRTMWVVLEDVAIDANRLDAFMEGKLDMCHLRCLAMVGHSVTTLTLSTLQPSLG